MRWGEWEAEYVEPAVRRPRPLGDGDGYEVSMPVERQVVVTELWRFDEEAGRCT